MKINKIQIQKIIAELQGRYIVDLSIAHFVANQMIAEGYEYASESQARTDFAETLRLAGALAAK